MAGKRAWNFFPCHVFFRIYRYQVIMSRLKAIIVVLLNLKLFIPFFITKPPGKATGLDLPLIQCKCTTDDYRVTQFQS